MNDTKTFDTARAIKAQAEFTGAKGYPHFAPRNGKCYHCRRDIYAPITHDDTSYVSGITVERAGTELITGCPHCCWSYCD